MRFTPVILALIMLSFSGLAATLQGNIYDSSLQLENDALVEIDTTPKQKYLAKNGTYSFDLSPGTYNLTVRSDQFTVIEQVEIISKTGEFVYDVFLLPDFVEEDELWQETEDEIPVDTEPFSLRAVIGYIIAGIIALFAIIRFIIARKKFGSLSKFRKRIKEDSKKTVEQHKEELAQEPGYLEKAIDIIKKHDGRISQKELRKEMLYLSEAKVSLILTELEHKGKVEKIKKGRGNVIILKE